MKVEPFNLSYYSGNTTIFTKEEKCDKEPCKKMNLKEFIVAYSNLSPLVCVSYPETINSSETSNRCENLTLNIIFGDIVNKNVIF